MEYIVTIRVADAKDAEDATEQAYRTLAMGGEPDAVEPVKPVRRWVVKLNDGTFLGQKEYGVVLLYHSVQEAKKKAQRFGGEHLFVTPQIEQQLKAIRSA